MFGVNGAFKKRAFMENKTLDGNHMISLLAGKCLSPFTRLTNNSLLTLKIRISIFDSKLNIFSQSNQDFHRFLTAHLQLLLID